jgi:hypothetical protein
VSAVKAYALCAFFGVTGVTALAVTLNYSVPPRVEAGHANRFTRSLGTKT